MNVILSNSLNSNSERMDFFFYKQRSPNVIYYKCPQETTYYTCSEFDIPVLSVSLISTEVSLMKIDKD